MAASGLGEPTLVALAFAILLGAAWLGKGAPPAPAGPTASDGVPSGTVTYFEGDACPAGWEPATQVAGRLVVGVVDPTQGGVTVGAPLGDLEDRTHSHAFSGTVTPSYKGLAALDGSNDTGAAAQGYAVAGATDAGTSGLPLYQMQACVKP
jgi:hypothetical protein